MTYIEKLNLLLSSISFDGQYEVAYEENSDIGIHFYFDEALTDPIFNESYTEISISVSDDKIESVKIGNNTIDFKY